MFKKPNFEDNIYMKMFYWVYLVLALNVALVLLNFPLFFVSLFMAFLPATYSIFWLCLFLMGPGIIALMTCIDTFYETKDLFPMKGFFQGVKTFWKAGLGYFSLFQIVFAISAVDIRFFYKTSLAPVVIPVFILLSSLTLGLVLNLMYFRIRNPKEPFKDIARISVYYLLKKWYVSLLNIVLFVGMLAFMLLKPQFGYIVTPTLFVGIIYLNCRKLHPIKETTEN